MGKREKDWRRPSRERAKRASVKTTAKEDRDNLWSAWGARTGEANAQPRTKSVETMM